MASSGTPSGNNSVLWEQLLTVLDERLQLGLLDRIRRVSVYQFEGTHLLIEAGTLEDANYLMKPSTLQTLKIFLSGIAEIEEVTIKSP